MSALTWFLAVTESPS